MSNDILTSIVESEAHIAEFPLGSIGYKRVNGKLY